MQIPSPLSPSEQTRIQVIQARQRRDNVLGVFTGMTVFAILFLTGMGLWLSRKDSTEPSSQEQSIAPSYTDVRLVKPRGDSPLYSHHLS